AVLDERAVDLSGHQGVGVCWVRWRDQYQPAVAVWLLIHELRPFVHQRVAFDDRAVDGAEDVRHRLRGLDLGERLSGVHVGADVGKIHVHDIAERVLREVGDADAHDAALWSDPLVLLRVPNVVRVLHELSSSSGGRSVRSGNDSRSDGESPTGRQDAVASARRMSPTYAPD